MDSKKIKAVMCFMQVTAG